MSLKSQIIGANNKEVAHLHHRNGDTGLLVFNHPFLEGVITGRPFTNPTYGSAMNQNVSFTGTPDQIHNGTDAVLWTGSNITGNKVTFDSTDRAKTGTKSVKVNNPSAGDTWQFAKGSNVTVANYTSLSLSVNIDQDWDTGDSVSVFGWDTGTGTIVGNVVLLENYIDETSFDVWQGVIIPLSDMGLTSGTIDAIRMSQVSKIGPAAIFYIDDFQIEETGNSEKFSASAVYGTRFHVNKLIFSWADVGTVGTAYAYDKIGAIASLSNGMNLEAFVGGKTIFSATVNNLGDLLAIGGIVENRVDDGTNTFITVGINFRDFDAPVVLNHFDSDEMRATVNDDLSGLLRFTMFVRGWTETLHT